MLPSQLFLGLMEPVLKTSRLVSADFVQCLWLRMVARKEQRLIVVRWGGLLTAAGTLSACSNSDDRATADPCSGKTIRAIQLSVGEFSYHNFSTHDDLLYESHFVSQQILRASPEPNIACLLLRCWSNFLLEKNLMTCWVAKTKSNQAKERTWSSLSGSLQWTHLNKQTKKGCLP